MRDIALLFVLFPMLYSCLRYVHIGAMFWIWTALASPSSFVFGFLLELPLNKLAVAGACVSLVVDRTKQRLFFDSPFMLHTLLVIQGVISVTFGLTEIVRTYDLLDRVVKVWILALFIHLANRKREQIHGIIITFTLSAGVHGILEAFKYIITLGSHKVQPAPSIGDNNYLAMMILMVIPFMLYIAKYSAEKYTKFAFQMMALFSAIGLVATASRGGLVAGMILGAMLLVRSKRKATGVLIAIVLGVSLVTLAPSSWWDRMDTIKTAESDGSFMSRVASWKMNTLVALDRPFLGGGYSSMEDPRVFRDYLPQFGMLDMVPTDAPVGPLAAHSIYFEVIGDLGFIGFALFLAMLASNVYSVRRVKIACRGRKDLEWADDLASAMLQMLVVYMVAGAALSAAYLELFYVQISVLSILRRSLAENYGVKAALPGIVPIGGRPAAGALVPAGWQRPQ